MMEDDVLIPKCVAAIEARLGWGQGAHWGQADFEKLSETIQAETGILLSVTTLKRVWGRVRYESRPTATTLNTLARFSGFESWRAFVRGMDRDGVFGQGGDEAGSLIQEMEEDRMSAAGVSGCDAIEMAGSGDTAVAGRVVGRNRKRAVVAAWVSGIVVVGVLLLFLSFEKGGRRRERIDVTKYAFSLNKMVTNGVPNSVVFSYDATAASSDSIYIAQTWDISRKVLVSKSGHHHSAIYYYPGYFRAKLMVGDSIVRTSDLKITTDGWLALAEGEPVPIYFKKEEFYRDSVVTVDEALLRKYNIPLLPHAPAIRLYNQLDLGDMRNDNFEFETMLRSRFDKGDNVCQHVQVLIHCKDDIIIVPLAARTCVGALQLFAAGASADSRSADLSRFGCDLHEWTKLKVVCVNGRMSFFVNGIEAYSFSITHEPTGIVGVQYRFNGAGEVKGAWFAGGGRRIEL